MGHGHGQVTVISSFISYSSNCARNPNSVDKFVSLLLKVTKLWGRYGGPTSDEFHFEIDNFSEKEGVISSPSFLSCGCQWFVNVHPKGDIVEDHLSLYLNVANPESLRLGWKRRASYSFFLLNQAGKELYRVPEWCELFCAQFSGWGWANAVPLKKLQEKGFLEKNKLIVKVEVKVVEVVDQGVVTGNEMFDFKGFQVLYSQVLSVTTLFVKHPDIAVNVKQRNQRVKTLYMNILLDLIETLNKPPHSISETELSNAGSELIDLTQAGFKLDWLKTKLDEVSLERKKENVGVQELEEHIKNLKFELNEEKVKSATSAAKVLSLEQALWDLKDEVSDKMSYLKDEVSYHRDEVSYLQNEVSYHKDEVSYLKKVVSYLKEEVSDLKVVVSDLIDSESEDSELEDEVLDLKDELNKNEAKYDTCGANGFSLDQTVTDLKDELKKNEARSDTCGANGFSLEQTVTDLKDELNKNEARSDTCAANGFSLKQAFSDLIAELYKNEARSATCAHGFSLEQVLTDLNKENGVVGSWEVLEYAGLHNEK
ncbi:unnamed protein product [Microthlaspi erraticum]|uniref:MATH domain-containing protein n=1 Tax=Microthlaspi erraticum TaxID=1685480 RepID=A0A6D2IH92_9BRAS|nr:unnamed protein product [Microthlaspi erraticum]